MKSGFVFAIIFAIAALLIFALLAPLLFQGGDMQKVGRTFFLPVAIIGGTTGYLLGRRRQN